MFERLEQELESRFILPLDIQYFAAANDDGDENGGTGSNDSGDNNPDNTPDNENLDDKGTNNDTQSNNDSGKGTKTFTQEDLNKIAAREAKRAQEKLLKQLGISDIKSAKEGLAKLKEMQDAQKTDLERAQDKLKEYEENYNESVSRIKQLEAENAALKADVNPEAISDVVVLANNLVDDETNIDDAISKVLEKYPHFKRTVETNDNKSNDKKPKFSNGDHKGDGKLTEAEQWAQAFKFGFE